MKYIVKLSKKLMSDEELMTTKKLRPGKLAKKIEVKLKEELVCQS